MEIVNIILSFCGGMLIVYLTAYTKAKSKNKALLEDIDNLEDEKQKIIAKYRAQTEELKKQHTLDIEKRKFQYEEKRAQFSKYFALLDEFHGKCNSVFAERFQPIMSEFMNGYLSDDPEEQHQAILKYSEDVQQLFFELNSEHLKIKTETNSIRLIATSEVDNLLDTLEERVKLATDQSAELLRFMATPEFWQDQSLVIPYQAAIEESGKKVLDSRYKLREQMKAELNEI